MDIDFLTFDNIRQLSETTTGTIAHFSDSLAALFLVAECSPRPRLALPENRKNAHSYLSNYRI
jgi:hypothetical protein